MPYSFKDVSVGAQVAGNPARPYLLFFRQAPEASQSHRKAVVLSHPSCTVLFIPMGLPAL